MCESNRKPLPNKKAVRLDLKQKYIKNVKIYRKPKKIYRKKN